MKAILAHEALWTAEHAMMSTGPGEQEIINEETGEVMSGVFHIVSMDVDNQHEDRLIVTTIEATSHESQPEVMASINQRAVVIVDIPF